MRHQRLWRLDDFRDLPFGAVAQALSRLTRAGGLQRLSKGLYYRARPTAFGPSRPNPVDLERLAAQHRPVFAAGTTAANLLGEDGRYERLARVAPSEPPRVRALLGALGEHMGKDGQTLAALRATLNPLSRFDFGLLAGLPSAPAWQARGPD